MFVLKLSGILMITSQMVNSRAPRARNIQSTPTTAKPFIIEPSRPASLDIEIDR